MAKTLQEQTDEFLIAVGKALRTWTGVEDAIVMTFNGAIGPDRDEEGILIMNAIRSFEVRVEVCNAIVRAALAEDPELPVWDKLIARVLKFYKKRHELAHFDLEVHLSDDGGDSKMVFQPFGVFPALSPKARSPLSIAQIHERIGKFEELRAGLLYFFWEKFIRPNSFGERPLGPVPDLILRLRKLAGQSPEAQQPPPQSSEE